MCFAFVVLNEFERAVVFRLGKVSGGPRGPGIIRIIPCIDKVTKLDMRTYSFDVAPQEILTKDSVTVAVDAVVFYRVNDPLKAIVQVADFRESTELLAATTLRNVLGTRDLSQLLSDREAISASMRAGLDHATEPWGIEVERVEIKDVRLPEQLQRAMAAEAEATREAKAKIITAEGEIKAAQALREASNLLTDNPTALQLRYLQALNSVSAEKNSTIVFPFPMEFLRGFMKGSPGWRSSSPRAIAAPPGYHHAGTDTKQTKGTDSDSYVEGTACCYV
ncbi:hypothetical protein PYW07_015512 [Mythimna separata]|uniref:Band 7 domain-containing protein n=1 Tax=Mythimna separata TaxID=271217 RepID=A0AAD7Z138_MYTSE|nr:hypothetical protein PYW07_015512 [Mythimna separata]